VNAGLLFAARILVALFFLGIAGSLIVVVITFVEDLELFVRDKETDASN
jgi:hypothetical protein